MLAGMVKAPSRYNPLVDPKRAAERAKLVLVNMVDAGYISRPATPTRAIAQGVATMKPPTGGERPVLSPTGCWTRCRATSTTPIATWWWSPPSIARAQQAAEAVVDKTLADADAAKNANQAALVAMSPDGAVRAMVGGRDYGASQFNRATQALRPPGSSFKLFVYLAAHGSGDEPGRHHGRRADLDRQLPAEQFRRQVSTARSPCARPSPARSTASRCRSPSASGLPR